jgi:hypothetical protein
MISFMISVVPPKIGWTRLSRQSSQSRRRSADQCWRRSSRAPSGQREPRRSRGAIWAATTRQGIVWPRGNSPSRGVAPTSTPNQRPRISQPSMRTSITGELIAAQLPQVLLMRDPSHDSQVRSRARKPPRGDQDLGRSSQCRRGPWVLPAGSGRETAHKASTQSETDEPANGNASERKPPRSRRCLSAAHGASWWSKGMLPGPLGTLPASGSMHRWFPAMVTESPISVSKGHQAAQTWWAQVGSNHRLLACKVHSYRRGTSLSVA